jgi:broad specificity phosphatase PhoE
MALLDHAMSFPMLHLVRHGETAWSVTGQHTGRTDIPLTPTGERHALGLAQRLAGMTFVDVFTSPLQRAAQTCALAGFGSVAQKDNDLVEWDYGLYEGKTSAEIKALRPDWQLFRDGCPGGESVEQVAARADRFIAKVRALAGDVLAFSSGHFSRMLAARWVALAALEGRRFHCDTASLGILGYDHSLAEPVVRLWNENCRFAAS